MSTTYRPEGASGLAWFSRRIAAIAVAATAAGAPLAHAAVTFQVSFYDPGSKYASYYDGIRSNVISAGNEWASHFSSSYSASLQVQMSFTDIATAAGYSMTNAYVGTYGGVATYEQGAAYEVLTGKDSNGSAPDISIAIGRNGYLQNELWFDPSPAKQTAAVPTNRTDARSVFVHELGHAFAFNGWRDGDTGALPGGYQSTFDSLVGAGSINGQPQLYFTGSQARSVYGANVPLTLGDYGHVGNATGAGTNLTSDLMNGVSFVRGSRYHVSALDLAILGDTGFPTQWQVAGGGAYPQGPAAVPLAAAIPEPSTFVLMLAGLSALAFVGRTRYRHRAALQR